MKVIFWMFLAIVIFLGSIACFAQTNVLPPSITVSNATQAVGALIRYEAPSVSPENALVIAGGIMGFVLAGAKYLRKLIPDSWQVNGAGLLLAHAAGELNPTIATLAADAVNAAALNTKPIVVAPVVAPAATVAATNQTKT